jgi:hypothetical protein
MIAADEVASQPPPLSTSQRIHAPNQHGNQALLLPLRTIAIAKCN